MSTSCDFCAYNEYDEDDEAYYCSVNMDEDDMARFMQSSYKECPYYRSGDEYRWFVTRCRVFGQIFCLVLCYIVSRFVSPDVVCPAS